MSKWSPGVFGISDAWADGLATLGQVDIGWFDESDLRAAEVPPVWEPADARPARTVPEAGLLTAEDPDLLTVLSAVCRRAFVIGMFYDGLFAPKSGPASDPKHFYGFKLDRGSDALLVAEGGPVWRYGLATFEAAAEQWSARVFTRRARDAADTQAGEGGCNAGWRATWPVPGIFNAIHDEDMTLIRPPGTFNRAIGMRVRNFGHDRASGDEAIDDVGVTERILEVLQQAARESSR